MDFRNCGHRKQYYTHGKHEGLNTRLMTRQGTPVNNEQTINQDKTKS